MSIQNALKISNQFVSSCSTEEKARTGRSIKISERGVRIVGRAANKLRFETLKLLIKAIMNNILQSDVCRIGVKYINRKIVHE